MGNDIWFYSWLFMLAIAILFFLLFLAYRSMWKDEQKNADTAHELHAFLQQENQNLLEERADFWKLIDELQADIHTLKQLTVKLPKGQKPYDLESL